MNVDARVDAEIDGQEHTVAETQLIMADDPKIGDVIAMIHGDTVLLETVTRVTHLPQSNGPRQVEVDTVYVYARSTSGPQKSTHTFSFIDFLTVL